MFLSIITQGNILQKTISNAKNLETKQLVFQDIEYSTFFGRCNFDWAMGIAVDNKGSAYITGFTRSFRFPTKNPYDKTYNFGGDAFIAKLEKH
jgi:hypothetical protein